MPVRPFRSLTRLALVAIAALALLVAPLGTGVARAEDGFRYWGYYQLNDGTWEFAQNAPGATVMDDGAVDGWRYAVAGMTTVRTPRSTPSFDEVCSKVRAVDGQKRVAVVIDPGTAEDAPQGDEPGTPTATCVVAPVEASGAQVLQLATEVRSDDAGMICGIGGYPGTGCADSVANISVPATDEPVAPELTEPAGDIDSDTPGWVWGVVGGLVVVLGGAGVLVARRRSA